MRSVPDDLVQAVAWYVPGADVRWLSYTCRRLYALLAHWYVAVTAQSLQRCELSDVQAALAHTRHLSVRLNQNRVHSQWGGALAPGSGLRTLALALASNHRSCDVQNLLSAVRSLRTLRVRINTAYSSRLIRYVTPVASTLTALELCVNDTLKPDWPAYACSVELPLLRRLRLDLVVPCHVQDFVRCLRLPQLSALAVAYTFGLLPDYVTLITDIGGIVSQLTKVELQVGDNCFQDLNAVSELCAATAAVANVHLAFEAGAEPLLQRCANAIERATGAGAWQTADRGRRLQCGSGQRWWLTRN